MVYASSSPNTGIILKLMGRICLTSFYHFPAIKCLRGFIRKILPNGMQNRLSLMPNYVSAFGFANGLKIYFQIALRTRGRVGVRMPENSHPFFIRARSSDIKIFEEIFVHNIYEIPVALSSPEFIIDGGANIGCACVFFAHQYSNARIIAVEPEGSNVALLKKNTFFYPNISVVQAGIWGKEAFLDIANPEAESSDFQLQESDLRLIRGLTIEAIRSQEGNRFIDILKLDIEGAEREVFSNPEGWLDHVNILIVELHGDNESLDKAIEKYKHVDYGKGDVRILQLKPLQQSERMSS